MQIWGFWGTDARGLGCSSRGFRVQIRHFWGAAPGWGVQPSPCSPRGARGAAGSCESRAGFILAAAAGPGAALGARVCECGSGQSHTYRNGLVFPNPARSHSLPRSSAGRDSLGLCGLAPAPAPAQAAPFCRPFFTQDDIFWEKKKKKSLFLGVTLLSAC